MKILAKLIPLSLLTPLFAFAQTGGSEFGQIAPFLRNIIGFMNGVLVPLIFAIAFLMFLWGMFKTFILGGSDPDKQAEGKSLMMYSIAGFVVMVSLWGIVNLIANGLGLRQQDVGTIPNLPTNNQ